MGREREQGKLSEGINAGERKNMENIEVEKKNTAEQKSEEMHRITVSKQAERALVGIVERVNDGFDGGRVNRTQIANWVLIRFSDELGESEIREIRTEHFDEIAQFETILKKAKELGKLPPEFKSLLQKQFGMEEQTKKLARKTLTKTAIIDDTINDGNKS